MTGFLFHAEFFQVDFQAVVFFLKKKVGAKYYVTEYGYLSLSYQSHEKRRNAMTKQIFDAIQRASKSSYPVDAWYNEDKMNQIISEAVKNGWAFRASHSQCEWTEKGIEAAKKSNLC